MGLMNGGTMSKKSKKVDEALTAVVIEGYRTFRESTRLEIRPLTVLAGSNSSGKSSLIQPPVVT